MKVLFLSDTHLGFGRNHKEYPERREDAYLAAKNAFSLVEATGASLVLHGGDFFDVLRPSLQTLGEAVDVLTSLPEADVKVTVEDWKGNRIYSREFERVPVVAVHGNHDWSQNRTQNIYSLLERAGLIVYAHRRIVRVNTDDGEVCVVGVGWIPDKYVQEVFSRIPPPPCEASYLLFHQPVKGLYPQNPREYLVPPSLFPEGYKLYLGGHLHWIVDKEVGGRRFLIPGSTVVTRLKDGEIGRQRIVYLLDGSTVTQLPIPGVRAAYQVTGTSMEEITAKIDTLLEKHAGPPPLVKVVFVGEKEGEIDEDYLKKTYRGKALIYVFDKRESSFLRRIREMKGEVSSDAFTREFVLEILKKKMGEEWEEWMEDLMRKAFEGSDEEALLNLLQGSKIEGKKERKEGILYWVEG